MTGKSEVNTDINYNNINKNRIEDIRYNNRSTDISDTSIGEDMDMDIRIEDGNNTDRGEEFTSEVVFSAREFGSVEQRDYVRQGCHVNTYKVT